MTKEELKEHCKKQIEMCEMWANSKGEEPSGKIYEEHKLILELLEQQPEIIKCKDCKQFRRWVDTDITFCDLTESSVFETDFCSRAESESEEV